MAKLRISALAAALLLALAGAASAWGAAGGNSNSGDAWLDTAGQQAGPGHEMDPHLPCQDISLWGAKLADGTGSYSIDGWPPSGGKEVDYSGTWNYDAGRGGDQVVATISVYELITTAQANGDHPAHNGYHFKLNFSQDPHKAKTFWVSCTSSQLAAMQTTLQRRSVRRTHHWRTRHETRHRRRYNATRISRHPRPARRTTGFTG